MANETVSYSPIAQMTIKKLGCDPKDAIRKNVQIFLCRIFGEAATLVTKEARTGDMYSYLIGEFRAVTADGKRYESGKLFLPGSLQEGVAGQLTSNEGKSVQFGFDIYSNPDEKSSVGYAYAAKPIIKTAITDRLEAMSAALEEGKPLPNAPVEKKVEEKSETVKALEVAKQAPAPAPAKK